MTPQERIKADAEALSGYNENRGDGGLVNKGRYYGYIAGATAENNRAQERDKIFKDAMQQVLNVASWADDPYKSTLRKVVNNAIEKWEGQEVEG